MNRNFFISERKGSQAHKPFLRKKNSFFLFQKKALSVHCIQTEGKKQEQFHSVLIKHVNYCYYHA